MRTITAFLFISLICCSQPTTVIREAVTVTDEPEPETSGEPPSTDPDPFESEESTESSNVPPVDEDGDGYSAEDDCNDNDNTVHTGADELCNNIDDDCDGEIDEGNPCSNECAPEVDPNLIVALQFSEESGVLCADATSNGYSGVIYGDFERLESPCGGAVGYNGTNTRISVSDALNPLLGDAVTMEVWVYLPNEEITHYPHLVAGGNNNYRLSLSPGGNGRRLLWRLEIEGAIQSVWYAPTEFPREQWVHVAGTFDGNEMNLFVDAILVGTKSVLGKIDVAQDLQIGGWDEIEQSYFKGALDEIRVWDVARSNSEICGDGGGEWTEDGCSYPPL